MNIVTRDEALACGLVRFFTGIPCKRGHICERHTKSKSCVECGNAASRQWNIDNQYGPTYRKTNSEQVRVTNKNWRQNNKDKCRQYSLTDSARIMSQLNQAKRRAKAKNVEFDLTTDDIVIPDVCPVLGIPIDRTAGHQGDNSPSIDRVDNTIGYTKTNIVVISWKANRLKNNATLTELKQIVEYMESHNGTTGSE